MGAFWGATGIRRLRSQTLYDPYNNRWLVFGVAEPGSVASSRFSWDLRHERPARDVAPLQDRYGRNADHRHLMGRLPDRRLQLGPRGDRGEHVHQRRQQLRPGESGGRGLCGAAEQHDQFREHVQRGRLVHHSACDDPTRRPWGTLYMVEHWDGSLRDVQLFLHPDAGLAACPDPRRRDTQGESARRVVGFLR